VGAIAAAPDDVVDHASIPFKRHGKSVADGSRSIKNEIWPLLRKSGFSAFSARTTWRFAPEQTHVVNFQSFNTCLAERLECTTVSFGLNLEIYFTATCVPPQVGRRRIDITPQEYQCHFRHHPLRRVDQSAFSRADIWYVQPDGMNLPEVMTHVRAVIEQEALPWFDGFGSIEEVLRRFVAGIDPGCRRHRSRSRRRRRRWPTVAQYGHDVGGSRNLRRTQSFG
jgi:hypothetical protein